MNIWRASLGETPIEKETIGEMTQSRFQMEPIQLSHL